MGVARHVLGSIAIAGAIAGMLVAFKYLPDDETRTASVPAATPVHSNNVLENKAFLAKNPRYVEAIRKLIAVNGFNCPRINILTVEGQTPYGLQLEAFCGPINSTGVIPSLHYAVYPDHLRVALCKPVGAFSAGSCD